MGEKAADILDGAAGPAADASAPAPAPELDPAAAVILPLKADAKPTPAAPTGGSSCAIARLSLSKV